MEKLMGGKCYWNKNEKPGECLSTEENLKSYCAHYGEKKACLEMEKLMGGKCYWNNDPSITTMAPIATTTPNEEPGECLSKEESLKSYCAHYGEKKACLEMEKLMGGKCYWNNAP